MSDSSTLRSGARTTGAPGQALIYISLLYPVAWAVGLAYFIWPLVTLPLLLSLLARRPVVPRGFGLWLLFLAWMLLSATQLDTNLRVGLFVWRALLYLSATVLFVYVFNLPRDTGVERRVLFALTLLWVEAILGGWAAVFLPHFSFRSPIEKILPGSVVHNPVAYAYIHPALSDVKSRALGYVIGRPKTLFAYTNHWGAAVGVLTPFAIAYLGYLRRGRGRLILIGLLTIAVVPIVVSLNRGLWLGLAVALVYAGARLATIGRWRLIGGGVVVAVLFASLIVATPLGHLVNDRLHSKTSSNQTRAALFHQAVQQVRQSPLVGYGSPRPSSKASDYQQAHTGTQGQLSLVLFSHGIPGIAFFVGWFFVVLRRTWRNLAVAPFWAHAALIVGLIESAFYDLLAVPICALMIAAALAMRGLVVAEASEPALSARTELVPSPSVATPVAIR